MIFVELLVSLVISVLVFIYAEEIAKFVDDLIGTSIMRDANNPWTYRIVAVLGGIFSLFRLGAYIVSR